MVKYILFGLLALGWLLPSPAQESHLGIEVEKPAVRIKTVVNDKEYERSEMIHGDISVPKDSVIGHDLVVSDGTITIDGTVIGDAVVFGGAIVVNGTVDGDAVAIGGAVKMFGTISGDVAAIGGSAEVHGAVAGDVAAIGGSLSLDSTAVVTGDVVIIGGTLDQKPGAVVKGKVEQVPLGFLNKLIPKFVEGIKSGKVDAEIHIPPFNGEVRLPPFVGRSLRLIFTLVWLVGVFILVLLITLIFPRPTQTIADAITHKPLIVFLVGFGGQLAISPLMVVLTITIIGIPLIPLALLGILIAFLLGWAGISLTVGEWLKKNWNWRFESPLGLMAVGFLAIVLLTIVAGLFRLAPGPIGVIGLIIAILGVSAVWVAVTFGFGACLLTRFGTKPYGNPK